MTVKKASKADMSFHARALLNFKREWTQTMCSTLTRNTDTFHFLCIKRLWSRKNFF